MKEVSFVYILTNKNNRVLYIGVTNDIKRRIWEHKQKIVEGFTKKYNVDKLVYHEVHDSIESAIKREKQLKAGSRDKKLSYILQVNKSWEDLYDKL